MFRKAVAIWLMFFLLWGNTGFCLNVHYCATSEAFSVMVNDLVGERCGKDMANETAAKHPHGEPKSCCKKLEQTLPSAKKGCCSDTEVKVKITDLFQGTFLQLDVQKQWNKVPYIPFTPYFSRYVSVPQNTAASESDPPEIPPGTLPTGQTILIQNSVFRI